MSMIEDIKAGLVDETELIDLVTDNNLSVAIAAAEAPNATEPILDIAAHDKDREVRWAALNNPKIGLETLKTLIYDCDKEISDRASELLEERNNEMVL